ncbi:hypothetical protein EKH55_1292 [Sinorhizobium alkalisoli]|nr:hypothetical protein EKH55_1292 [Sinorhizobium alkalisoli]
MSRSAVIGTLSAATRDSPAGGRQTSASPRPTLRRLRSRRELPGNVTTAHKLSLPLTQAQHSVPHVCRYHGCSHFVAGNGHNVP